MNQLNPELYHFWKGKLVSLYCFRVNYVPYAAWYDYNSHVIHVVGESGIRGSFAPSKIITSKNPADFLIQAEVQGWLANINGENSHA